MSVCVCQRHGKPGQAKNQANVRLAASLCLLGLWFGGCFVWHIVLVFRGAIAVVHLFLAHSSFFFFGASFCVVARNAAWRSLPFLESANDDDAAAACTTPLCCCCWWWHACTRCSSVAEHCRTWCQETARGGTRERKAREQARAHQTGKGGGMGCCVQAAKHSVPRANFEAQDCARRLDGRIVCACVPGLPGRHAGFPRDWRCGCCHRLCHRRAVCPILVRSTRRRPSRRVPEQGPRQDIASHVLGATQGRCAPHVSPPSSAPRPH